MKWHDWLTLAVCVPVMAWAVVVWWRPRPPRLWHVQVKGGGIIYQNFWTTNPPPAPHKHVSYEDVLWLDASNQLQNYEKAHH
jgi:hypothetical protein